MSSISIYYSTDGWAIWLPSSFAYSCVWYFRTWLQRKTNQIIPRPKEGQVRNTHKKRVLFSHKGAVPWISMWINIPLSLLAPVLVPCTQTVAHQMKDILALRAHNLDAARGEFRRTFPQSLSQVIWFIFEAVFRIQSLFLWLLWPQATLCAWKS